MEKSAFFSIIIPVYKVEEYLHECIDSVLAQSFKEFEVILVDDGSPDRCPQICDEYSQKDKRIRVIHKKNGGLSDARNAGLKYVSGSFIVFLDSDDYIDSDLLLMVKNEIDEYDKLDVIRYPKRIVNESDGSIIPDAVNDFHNVQGTEAFLLLLENNIILETSCTYCFNFDYWKKMSLGFAVGRYHEDFGLIPGLIIRADNVSSISSPAMYNYRIRKNSITTNKDLRTEIKKTEDVIYFYKEQCESLESYNLPEIARKKYLQFFSDAVLIKLLILPKKIRSDYKGIYNEAVKKYPVADFKGMLKKIYYSVIRYLK